MDVRVINTVKKIAKQHSLTYQDIMNESRQAQVVRARNEVFVILRDKYLMTFELIGYWFKKNHATVLHGYNKLKKEGFSIKHRSSHYVVALNELNNKKALLVDELNSLNKAIELLDKVFNNHNCNKASNI